MEQQPGGWSSLSRNLLITQTPGAQVLLESNAITPQSQVTDGFRPLALWLAAAAASLILATPHELDEEYHHDGRWSA